jgi:hypothetical protein
MASIKSENNMTRATRLKDQQRDAEIARLKAQLVKAQAEITKLRAFIATVKSL